MTTRCSYGWTTSVCDSRLRISSPGRRRSRKDHHCNDLSLSLSLFLPDEMTILSTQYSHEEINGMDSQRGWIAGGCETIGADVYLPPPSGFLGLIWKARPSLTPWLSYLGPLSSWLLAEWWSPMEMAEMNSVVGGRALVASTSLVVSCKLETHQRNMLASDHEWGFILRSLYVK